MRIFIAVFVFLIALVLGVFLWENFKGAIFGKPAEISVTHNTVLQEITSMGKVELVRFNFRDVVEYEVKYQWIPNSKAILIVNGEAVGCIDLQKIQNADMKDTKDTLYLMLPSPELCYTKVNHKDSKVYDTKFTYFDDAKLVDEAYKVAEKEITNIALKSNILEQTKESADRMLKPMLEKIARKKVVFSYVMKTPVIKDKK